MNEELQKLVAKVEELERLVDWQEERIKELEEWMVAMRRIQE